MEAPVRQWPPAVSTLDRYDELGSQEEQTNFLKQHILPQPAFRKLFGVRPIIVNCILKYGLDPARNPFLRFLTSLNVDMNDSKTYRQKVQYLYNAFENKHITPTQLKMDVFNNPTLYTRNYKDFQYTVKAFLTFSDPKKVSVYLKDTSKVNIGAFMNGNIIKPAGLNGKGGPTDTIYNVIEGWASKGNEYSEEEIADRKQQAEKEKEKEKGTGKTEKSNKIEWSYEYFKEELEKIFANSSKFKINGKKNDYLNKVFATFTLPTLTPVETENKVYKTSTSGVKDADVSKFGQPHNIDVPIPLTVRTAKETLPGIYAFNQFIPLDEQSITMYKQIANKNLGNLKRHLHNVSPNDDTGVDTHLQSILDAVGSLQGITHK